jgi:hypothetical protein
MTKKQWGTVIVASVSISVVAGVILFFVIRKNNNRSKLSKKKLIDIVKEDVTYWKGVNEIDEKGATKLKEWWSWIGLNYSLAQLMSSSFQNSHYWSAVYISALMRRWGAGNGFKYSASHSTYIVDGKIARENNDKSKVFHSYRPTEVPVEIGDIVGNSRQAGINYDNIYVGAPTHTDVVYDVVKKGEGYQAYVIGGNLGNTVQIKAIDLDKNKMLINPSNYLTVMKNQIA